VVGAAGRRLLCGLVSGSVEPLWPAVVVVVLVGGQARAGSASSRLKAARMALAQGQSAGR
jgi:hypothetical protein